jgi:upstream activation factor subunit UAF30
MNDSDHGLNLEFNLPAEHLVATPHVDEDQLNGAIRSILHGADLEQLSRRMIRKQLEAQFHMDLSHFKDKINECILQIIEEQQQAEEGDDDEPEPSDADDDNDEDDDEEEERRPSPSKAKKTKAKSAPAKKKPAAPKRKRGDDAGSSGNGGSSAFNMKLSLSPELASVVGADTMARPQIVKALWEYIREHDLQDPNNKRVIIFDEKLREVFQRDSVTMFSVNKFVKRHVRKPEELPPGGWADIPRDGISSDEDEADKATKKKAAAAKKKKKAASNADDEDGEKKQRKNPFNAELAISPELAVVVGSDRLARPQIVKQIWEYIRAHNLQDPNDKRTILLDETMRRAFQRDTVTMFSINKYIKRHAMKPENLPPGGWADVPRDGASSDEDEDSGKSKKKKAKK